MRSLIFINYNPDVRLDRFILSEIRKLESLRDKYSRNKIQEFVSSGCVKKNGILIEDNSCKLKVGEQITMELSEDIGAIRPRSEKIPLNIVYEDNDLLVIDKQAGLATHPPGFGNLSATTLVNGLLWHCGSNLSDIGGELRPGIVHRLDKDSSGLMVVAKNNASHESLRTQLSERQLKRVYFAVIWGIMVLKNGKIEGFIHRHSYNRLKMTMGSSGRYSMTNYRVLREFGDIASLVECKLDTGRTHQIRVHFSNLRHPLIGDKLYDGNLRKIKGEEKDSRHEFIENFPRQALHSKHLSFSHPTTGELLNFESDMPADIQSLVTNLDSLTTHCQPTGIPSEGI
ncbi:MAG: RluA family pseudouridine synthase [Rickettsiales bacterium]|jgi:23S rRNA pseudouridine1911/1915/1917 synthase|nr:RluA family pseudouridine synthase [Rickettsiales bacterium]